MARKRQLDPEYPFEEEIARLSIPARYFYILSWCHMSDPNPKEKIIGGVLPNNVFKLKGQIFPTDDIDVAAIVNELISMKRVFEFEADNKKWLWCPTMAKHQAIQYPSKFKYPDPPPKLVEEYNTHRALNEPSMSPHRALTKSRVELSRVELSSKAEPSEALTVALDKVYNKNKGLNIYSLMSKLKKLIGQPKEWQFPEEVLLRVCEAYERDKANIKHPWPWFKKVLREETALWHAQQQITMNKKREDFAPAIKDILRMK